MSLIEVRSVNTLRGAVQVLSNISFSMGPGEILGILGRNGAGKSTILNTIMGLVPAYSGNIFFGGIDLVQPEISHEKVTKIVSKTARMGISLVPEDKRIFPNLTVIENLRMGAKPGPDGKTRWTVDRAFEVFPKLATMKSRLGYYLSGGEKQMLTIARALVGNPSLLLLDEPSEGIAPAVAEQLGTEITRLKNDGISIIICEQNEAFLENICNSVIFLELGAVRFQGSMKEFKDQKISDKFNLSSSTF